MGISSTDFQRMQARLGAKGAEPERESQLHERIIEHCEAQWPRWKYIRARMDRKSTIQVGAQDFTIFLPGGKTLCIECKKSGEKLSLDQNSWRMEMNKLGHDIKVVTTMNEFMDVIKGATE